MAGETTIRNIIVSTDQPVRGLMESWQRALYGKSPRTIENYLGTVRSFTRWSTENGLPIHPAEQTVDQVRRFIGDRLDHAQRSSVVLWFRCLQQWFQWLVNEKDITVSPMAGLKAPAQDEAVTPVITENDLKNLLAVTAGNDWLDRRDHAIIRTFIDTGMRLGELVGMRRADVDLDNRVILLRATKNKRDRLVPIGDKTTLALDRYERARARRKGADSGMFWIGTRGSIGSNGVGAMLKARAAQAGMDHLHAHQFRHTAAHRWLAAGGTEGDLMRLGGWKNPTMLQRYGRSAAEERARDAHRRLAPGDSL